MLLHLEIAYGLITASNEPAPGARARSAFIEDINQAREGASNLTACLYGAYFVRSFQLLILIKTLILLVPAEGFEPPTFGLQNRCTTTVLSRQSVKRDAIGASTISKRPFYHEIVYFKGIWHRTISKPASRRNKNAVTITLSQAIDFTRRFYFRLPASPGVPRWPYSFSKTARNARWARADAPRLKLLLNVRNPAASEAAVKIRAAACRKQFRKSDETGERKCCHAFFAINNLEYL